jgi:hypothetical protein
LHGEIVVRSAWVWWALTAGVVLFVLFMLALIFGVNTPAELLFQAI